MLLWDEFELGFHFVLVSHRTEMCVGDEDRETAAHKQAFEEWWLHGVGMDQEDAAQHVSTLIHSMLRLCGLLMCAQGGTVFGIPCIKRNLRARALTFLSSVRCSRSYLRCLLSKI